MTLSQGLVGHRESVTCASPEGHLRWVAARVGRYLRGPANWESALYLDKALLLKRFQSGYM